MISKIAVVIRLFIFIFVFCFALMFLFASLPVILVTAAILTAMQGINWLFVNVGMNVIYGDDEQYQEARNQGYDPFVESLPDFIKRQHKGE